MNTLLKCSAFFLLFAAVAHATVSSADVLAALISANDTRITHELQDPGLLSARKARNPRSMGAEIMTLAVAYAEPRSKYYHNTKVLTRMENIADDLKKMQLSDGLFNVGNLDSPPDSAFILKTLAKGQLFLVHDKATAAQGLRMRLKALILAIAEGVRTGGVHTPNHRWAICSALAHANELYPNPKYIERINDWLGEGIDQDADGQFSERSPNYTADVNDPSLLDVAIILHRPELIDYVRRNLEMTIYHVDVNGEVETVASRRQDQAQSARKYIWEYYYPYRYLAIKDGEAQG